MSVSDFPCSLSSKWHYLLRNCNYPTCVSAPFLMLETRYQTESIKWKKFYSGSWFKRGGEAMAEGLSGQGKGMHSGSKTARQEVDLELAFKVDVTFKGHLMDRAPYTKGSTIPKGSSSPCWEPDIQGRKTLRGQSHSWGEKYTLFTRLNSWKKSTDFFLWEERKHPFGFESFSG